MRPRAIPFVLSVAAAFSVPTMCAPELRADDTEACITSHEQSQVLRREGKLRKAREAMITCSRDVCPKVLRKDCSGWLSEVEESIPSVVVEAKGPDGQDVIEMKVTMDGEPLLDKLDGRAVNVDPGVHVFKFEIPKLKAREEKIVIREGQKNRKISVDFSPPKPASTAAPAPTAGVPDAVEIKRPTPALVYVLGGLGLVALGGSAFFEARGLSQRSDLDAKGCKPACDKGEVDSAKQSILIGDIALGAGIASLGVATILYLARPSISIKKEAAAFNLDVRQVHGGAMAGFRGSF